MGQLLCGEAALLASTREVMLVTVPSKLIRLQGSIKGKPEVLLIDSGASHNFISLRVCRKLPLDVVKSPSINVKLADSSVIQTCG